MGMNVKTGGRIRVGDGVGGFIGLRAPLDAVTPLGYIDSMETTNTTDLAASQPDEVALPASPGRRSTSYAADKAKILARLRRLEGQVRGVQRMVEQDQYCVDVLTQLSAIIAAARTVGLLVLEDHIRGCVLGAPAEEREAVLGELTEAIERFTRSAS